MADIPATRASLLLRLRDARNEAAWREFVDLYGPLVYNYARKQGLQDADAADLSQDVLLTVATAVGRLEYDPRRGAFRNWLFTVIRHKLTNRRLAASNRTRGSGDPATQALLEKCLAPATEESQWQAEWQNRLFVWACEQVRPEVSATTWQAFWKTAIEGQPSKQVAEQLGLSLASIYGSRSRILARLRELVQAAQEP
jgi:RNA polymerase sigma-70 factor (ECF subfamily)